MEDEKKQIISEYMKELNAKSRESLKAKLGSPEAVSQFFSEIRSRRTNYHKRSKRAAA